MEFNLHIKSIHTGVFDYTVHFVCGDYSEARKFASWKLGCDIPNDEEGELRGKTWHLDGHGPVVWIPKEPKTPREFATLAHEMFHATCRMAEWVCIPLTYSSEEVFAHSQAWLVSQALESFGEDNVTEIGNIKINR